MKNRVDWLDSSASTLAFSVDVSRYCGVNRNIPVYAMRTTDAQPTLVGLSRTWTSNARTGQVFLVMRNCPDACKDKFELYAVDFRRTEPIVHLSSVDMNVLVADAIRPALSREAVLLYGLGLTDDEPKGLLHYRVPNLEWRAAFTSTGDVTELVFSPNGDNVLLLHRDGSVVVLTLSKASIHSVPGVKATSAKWLNDVKILLFRSDLTLYEMSDVFGHISWKMKLTSHMPVESRVASAISITPEGRD